MNPAKCQKMVLTQQGVKHKSHQCRNAWKNAKTMLCGTHLREKLRREAPAGIVYVTCDRCLGTGKAIRFTRHTADHHRVRTGDEHDLSDTTESCACGEENCEGSQVGGRSDQAGSF